MLEVLQSYFGQLMGWIIPPSIPFIYELIQRKRKDLGWEVVSRWHLFNNDTKKHGNLHLTQNGRPIEDVDFVAIRISNEGNMDVRQGDYNNAITVVVNEGAQILSAYISDKKPEGLPVENISFNGAKAHLGEVPMNAGDSLTVNMYVSGLNGYPRVITHIIGLNDIRELPRRHERQLEQNIIIGVALIFMARTLPLSPLETALGYASQPYPFLFIFIPLLFYILWAKLRRSDRR